MQIKDVRCVICGKEQKISPMDYAALVEVLGKSEVDKIDICICGACGETERYKRQFYRRRIPHIVLA